MPAIEIVIFLLIVAAGLEVISRRIGVPRPILLVVAGTLLTLFPAAPRVQPDPDVIFFIFLPPLLYWSAINTSYRDFRRNARDIFLLAVGLVVATAAAVAAVAHALAPGLSWSAAFALGAAVGPTDAVAATAVMRRFGVPRSLVAVLEGESLVNDATSLVIFEMAMVASATGTFSLGPALLRFVWAAGGGIVCGLAMGWCIAKLRLWLAATRDRAPVVESCVSLLTPYVVFAAADRLGVSGVLAVVTVGVYLGHAAPRLLSAESRVQAINMWEIVDFLLEGILFILVGLGLRVAVQAGAESTTPGIAVTAALVCAAVIVLRLAWVFPAGYLPRYVLRRYFGHRDPDPPWQNVLFIGWAGMRGAVSLVLALSIPFVTANGAPFPGRGLVIFLTFVVILVTLVGQGLTLRPLIRWLDLKPSRGAVREEVVARLQTTQAALSYLDRLVAGDLQSAGDAANADGSPASLDDPETRRVAAELHQRFAHRIHDYTARAREHALLPAPRPIRADDPDVVEANLDARRARAYRWLRLAMLGVERQELIRLRDEGKIADGVLHRVEHDLDLEEMLLRANPT